MIDPGLGVATDAEQREILAAARRARRPARVASFIAIAAGLLDLGSAALPAQAHRIDRLHHLIPGIVSSGATAVTAASGVALIALAGALRRRSRLAWFIVVLLLAGSAIAHMLKGLDFEEAIIESFIAGFMAGKSEHFRARTRFDRHRHTVKSVAWVLVGTCVFGIVAIKTLHSNSSLATAFVETLRMATTVQTSLPLPRFASHALPMSIAAVFYCGLLVVVITVFAPHSPRRSTPVTKDELANADDSLGWFSTRDDRVTVRSRGVAIAYGTEGGVALASGDPIGPHDSWLGAIETFLTESANQGRVPAVMGCGLEAARAYESLGLRRLYIGDEAVIDTPAMRLDGGSMKTVRQSYNRALNAGYTATIIRTKDIDEATGKALLQISNRWRGEASERGFSMTLGRLLDERDGEAMFIVGKDGDGVIRGFIHLVPWANDGASLDIMRRDHTALAVLNDFLVVSTAQQLSQMNITRLSLNFSVMRAVLVAGGELDAPWRLRMQRKVLLALSGRMQIETLYRFNKKFGPRWEPRFLMLESPEDAPRVLTAAMRAEGFLNTPQVVKRAMVRLRSDNEEAA